ncbi:hypothetical protein AKJ16_DCAP20201 [Drosera capensis]
MKSRLVEFADTGDDFNHHYCKGKSPESGLEVLPQIDDAPVDKGLIGFQLRASSLRSTPVAADIPAKEKLRVSD